MNGAVMIRLLIVENQPGVRQGLQMRLSAEADFTVIGEAADGAAAVDLAILLRPDVVLMDVDMPRLDGIATVSALRSLCPHASIIMLSFQDDTHTRTLAEQAGAAAFVAKSMPADALLTAIRQVSRQPRSGPTVPAFLPTSKEKYHG
jgi:DNA-binding NarL/FixJ family response regulator